MPLLISHLWFWNLVHQVKNTISSHNNCTLSKMWLKFKCRWIFFFLCFNMISKVEECRGGCGSESLGMSQGDGLHILWGWLTAWLDSPGHPWRVALATVLGQEKWLLPKANNLRPTVFIWAHQVNRCFPERQPLSFSLCQEPLETLYEDN